MTKKSAMTKLDLIFSEYIRRRDGYEVNGGLGGYCITCGQYAEGSQWQCGHFVKRGILAVRWDEHNAHGQCKKCNHFLSGNEGVYAHKIIELYGMEELDRLHAARYTVNKFALYDVEKMIQEYAEKLKKMRR